MSNNTCTFTLIRGLRKGQHCGRRNVKDKNGCKAHCDKEQSATQIETAKKESAYTPIDNPNLENELILSSFLITLNSEQNYDDMSPDYQTSFVRFVQYLFRGDQKIRKFLVNKGDVQGVNDFKVDYIWRTSGVHHNVYVLALVTFNHHSNFCFDCDAIKELAKMFEFKISIKIKGPCDPDRQQQDFDKFSKLDEGKFNLEE